MHGWYPEKSMYITCEKVWHCAFCELGSINRAALQIYRLQKWDWDDLCCFSGLRTRWFLGILNLSQQQTQNLAHGSCLIIGWLHENMTFNCMQMKKSLRKVNYMLLPHAAIPTGVLFFFFFLERNKMKAYSM